MGAGAGSGPAPRAPSAAGRRIHLLALAGVLAVAAVLVVLSSRRLSTTVDEPTHILSGLEWLERGTYTLSPENPPLARLAVALGPYLDGVRVFPGGRPDTAAADRALAHRDHRTPIVELARLGVLPLLLASIALVAALGSLHMDAGRGVLAAGLFAALPAVLAHGGLATTDMAAVFAFALAWIAIESWLRLPSIPRSVAAGAVLGAALCTKFSLAGYLLILAAGLVVLRRLERGALGAWRGSLLPMAAALGLTVWAVYRFSFGAVAAGDSARALPQVLDRCLGAGSLLRPLADRAVRVALPVPELVRGALDLCAHDAAGHPAYALGTIRSSGFWYYFPLGLAVKTPLAFSALALTGLVAGLRARERSGRRLAAVLALVATLMLALSSASRINIGIRHVLPIYLPLALLAASGARALFLSAWLPAALARVLAVALVSGSLLAGPLSFPGFLSYFNVLAGPDPSRVLLDSDLDWGQDLPQLERAVKELGIEQLHLAYFGKSLACQYALPADTTWLEPRRPERGWIAISEMILKGVVTIEAEGGQFCDHASLRQTLEAGRPYAWLDRYRPVGFAGRSIRLYHIP